MPRRTITLLTLTTALLLAPAPLTTAQQPYVLGPEDVIEVVIYGQPDLSRTVAILPDGTISLPLVGIVRAAGLTIEELTRRLTEAYAVYLKHPQVSVVVREFRRIRVSVIGQVTRPGTYELRPGATVLDALSAAGGLTDRASLADARLVRASGETVPLLLEALLVRQQLEHNLPVQAGDTLIVAEDTTNRFYVLGDVNSPGLFPLRGEVTVLQALAMAGGPVQRGAATARTVHIVRRAGAAPPPAAGRVERLPNNGMLITVDLQAVMQRGDLSRDLLVQAGDIIVVPQAGLTSVSTLISILAGIAAIVK
jgi:polysaccharide export outer membrane protein